MWTMLEPASGLFEPAEPPSGPLSGVPVALKDLISHRGRLTTCGSAFYRDIPTSSAPVVERLEDAGAVIIGRTGLHEFAWGFSSENPWFGPVRNPWDPRTSPGGSSGGSAVAVATGIVPLAVGTDTGGSIRVPAALTGVLGLKVTLGRITTAGVFPLSFSLDTVGPLARTVAMLATGYQVMAGLRTEPVAAVPFAGLRVAVPQPWVERAPADSEVAAGLQEAINRFRALGAEIISIQDPLMLPFGRITDLFGPEAAYVHRGWRLESKPYGTDVAQRLDLAMAVTPDSYLEAQRWRSELQAAFAAAFQRADLLLTPTVAAMRKTIGEDLIGNEHHRTVLSWFSALVNHAGCPAIALPLAAAGNPPPSIQLIAPWWRENLLLGAAAALESEAVIAFRSPPGFPV
jgi:aspartyl-tRNA(Asn)/glutamyl-tRNA(Gln) amidotransferase subunit A